MAGKMMFSRSRSIVLLQKQAAVAIAEEAEIVVEGILVAVVPRIADEGRHKEQEGTLGLVEVGDEAVDDMIGVPWGNH